MRKIGLFFIICLFMVGCNFTDEVGGKPQDKGGLETSQLFYNVEEKIENNNEFDLGSKIEEIKITENNIDHLTLVGKVWGYIKYYHPNVVEGRYNWDYELFRVLSKIIDVEDSIKRDEILYHWIESQDEFEINNNTMGNTEAKLNPDLNWIEDSNLKEELELQLIDIKNANRKDMSSFVEIDPYALSPNFKNENPYSEMNYPDAGYRLLSLYRYWNIIEYYFPYKYAIGEDWDNVLEEFIPKFINASNELEYHLVVLELITRINDAHAVIQNSEILDNYWGINYSPVKVEFIEEQLMVTDYYNKDLGEQSGLHIGDIIGKIDGKPVGEIVSERMPYTPASNHPTKLRNISRDILRTNEDFLKIELIRNDEHIQIDVPSYSKEELSRDMAELDRRIKQRYQEDYFKMIDSDVAYIYPGSIKAEYLPQIIEEIEDTKGLIIDLRCYPLEPVIGILGEYLIPQVTEFVRPSIGSIKEPGFFELAEGITIGAVNDHYYKGKVVIMINEISQSQSEFTTMAFERAYNATVIGSNSAGADGSVSYFHLPGNIYTRITGSGVYYPDGGETQRIGIVPDVEIKPTIEGIRANKDEVLDKAIEIINGE